MRTSQICPWATTRGLLRNIGDAVNAEIPRHVQNLTTPYTPVAAYYSDADSVEYIRKDVPAVYRRVDEVLTLILDINNREELIGFRLKGFNSFYRQEMRDLGDFVSLVGALERALSTAGDKVFAERDRQEAYARARRIALDDKVELTDLPKSAAR